MTADRNADTAYKQTPEYTPRTSTTNATAYTPTLYPTTPTTRPSTTADTTHTNQHATSSTDQHHNFTHHPNIDIPTPMYSTVRQLQRCVAVGHPYIRLPFRTKTTHRTRYTSTLPTHQTTAQHPPSPCSQTFQPTLERARRHPSQKACTYAPHRR